MPWVLFSGYVLFFHEEEYSTRLLLNENKGNLLPVYGTVVNTTR